MFKPCKETKNNSGVALIMVLGLLTVMVLLAVTFAISMRTERLAAGNYADTVRARELVRVGLARAMNQLAAELGSNGLYSQPVGVGKVYPNWSVTNSYTNSNGDPRARWNYTNALIQKSATNYVPRVLWAEATNVDSSIYLNPSNHWLPVESLIYTNSGINLVESNLMGRVAYVILNCSGLLDANYVGGSPRTNGTIPNEIAIGNLDEIGINSNDFISARASDVRYETLAQLNSSMTNFGKQATNLFVYSRALPGYWSTNLSCVATQVNLSGGRAELESRQSEIFNALANAGFSNQELSVIFNNLLDYVDLDSKPDYYTTPVESVPMINEVVVSNSVIVADGSTSGKKYTINTTVFVECWYPFVTNASGPFDLNSSVTFSAPGLFAPDIVSPLPVSLGSFSPRSFIVKSCCNKSYGPYDNIAPAVNPVKLISAVTLNVKLGADIVDQINVPISLTNENDGINNNTYVTFASAECLDPRFNFDPDDPDQWVKRTGSAGTLNATNACTTNYLYSISPVNDGDTNTEMYVANRPLQSVAELGYLVYSSNAPWHTIRLYGTNLHRVLDVFGLSTNTSDVFMTNTVYRGLVNCNPNVATDATADAFADMPVDQYPGGTPTKYLDMTEARSVATNIFHGGICTNLSDIGRALTNFPFGSTEFERESYFRNSMNLINLRQNVFTIIIEAQAASNGNIPKNPARQRAVAIVWRDPYTGEMFIRHIKWLGD